MEVLKQLDVKGAKSTAPYLSAPENFQPHVELANGMPILYPRPDLGRKLCGVDASS